MFAEKCDGSVFYSIQNITYYSEYYKYHSEYYRYLLSILPFSCSRFHQGPTNYGHYGPPFGSPVYPPGEIQPHFPRERFPGAPLGGGGPPVGPGSGFPDWRGNKERDYRRDYDRRPPPTNS